MIPLFSVIVPVYNVERYIEKCLKSIYEQTIDDYEVIIINDGTKDKSCEIIEQNCLYDNRFHFYSKENGGLSSARNEGMKYAKGKYLLFLDSDDWIEENYLESIKNVIEDDSDVLICKYQLDDTVIGSRYIPYQSEHINVSYTKEKKEKEIVERHLIAYPKSGYEINDTIMPVWKNIYKREFLEDIDLKFVSEREVMAEDYVFNTSAYYYAKKVQVTDIAGYVHVIVPGTLSRSYRPNAFEMSIYKHNYITAFIESNEFCNKQSIIDAERTYFASSVASDIRNLCISNEKNKTKIISKWYRQQNVEELFMNKVNLNLQYSLRFCTWVMMFRLPVACIIAFRFISRFNILYRKIQKMTRK